MNEDSLTFESRHLAVLWLGQAAQGAGHVSTLISNPFRMYFTTSKCMNMNYTQSKNAFSKDECACLLCEVRGVCVRVTGRLNLLGEGIYEVCVRERVKPKEINFFKCILRHADRSAHRHMKMLSQRAGLL